MTILLGPGQYAMTAAEMDMNYGSQDSSLPLSFLECMQRDYKIVATDGGNQYCMSGRVSSKCEVIGDHWECGFVKQANLSYFEPVYHFLSNGQK